MNINNAGTISFGDMFCFDTDPYKRNGFELVAMFLSNPAIFLLRLRYCLFLFIYLWVDAIG